MQLNLTYSDLTPPPQTLLPLLVMMDKSGVPSWVKDAGHLVHRLHLLLFLPMYAFTSDAFLACLNAWGRFLLRKVACSDLRRRRRAAAAGGREGVSIL